MSIIIAISNVAAKLVNADQTAVSIVSDCLSYDVESAKYTAGFKMGTWNGKKTFLKYPDLVFEAGFVPMVKQALTDAGIPVSVHDKRVPVEIRADEIALNGIELRDYQIRAIEILEREKRGVLQVATGGGKTEIAIAATRRFGLKTLFLTHKLDLVRQTRKRYHDRLGTHAGQISEGEWMPAEITVATVQTIMAHWTKIWTVRGSKLDGAKLEHVETTARGMTESDARRYAKKTLKMVSIDHIEMKEDMTEKVRTFLHSIEFLIVDEAHRASGNSFFKIVQECKNAYYRCGLTATPLMKGNREDDLKLIAQTGDVIYRITNNDLIQLGILAQPRFRFVQVDKFPTPGGVYPGKLDYHPIYRIGIVENEERNKLVVRETRSLVMEGRQTVVLVKEIKHGNILYEMMRKNGLKVEWVAGKDNADKRDAALNRLRTGEINVLIASTILDEGLDCDAISGIVLAGGGKSKIALFQRVGRSVRKKKGDTLAKIGNTARIVDFIDTGDIRLYRHSGERFRSVHTEPGWIIDSIESIANRESAQLEIAV
ncbi:MAG: DEAD/DEAH box helicase [Alphaproteobacteria bacterium]|nr:DEAD/DEAH box helicase [Alphaproteobacteria bacterium]